VAGHEPETAPSPAPVLANAIGLPPSTSASPIDVNQASQAAMTSAISASDSGIGPGLLVLW